MKILHISPNGSFNDGWGYQENLLPKYQHLLGNEVVLLVVNRCWAQQKSVTVPCKVFVSRDGFKVIQREIKKVWTRKITNILSHMEIYDVLLDFRPDYIHFHGLVSNTINQVVRYKKRINPQAIIVMDNHLDYNIDLLHKKKLGISLIRLYYRILFWKNKKYISKVYGVTPWRQQYAVDVFGVPKNMTGVMIMGGDDEMINFQDRDKIRKEVRKQNNIDEKAFLIVTGGKIDKNKKIDLLMEACASIPSIQLLIFGSVLDDVKNVFFDLLQKNSNLIYIKWASTQEQYNFYFAADLVVFPGQHSVMWEQACAAKTPCLFGKWPGMDHVNNGGNCDFIEDVSVSGIRSKILEIISTDKYDSMKKVARSNATDIYLYSSIARKSLEYANN